MSESDSTDEFGLYAKYYDLLYRDKDYHAEADYVTGLLRELAGDTRTLLELGCGTGIHAEWLVQSGFDVVGVERSDSMFSQAKARADRLPTSTGAAAFRPVHCTAQEFRSDEIFDAVISLFHVVSYQTDDEAIDGFFQSVRRHLRPGGLFLFDVWYGPAVLVQRPQCRVKRMSSDSLSVIRTADPQLDTSANVVHVQYDIFAKESGEVSFHQFRERHSMRYFFATELRQIAKQYHMQIRRSEEWRTGNELSESTWGACFVLQKEGITN